MFTRNMSQFDRILRSVVGAVLLLVGLFPLEGWKSNSTGVYVIAAALALLATGLSGFCITYKILGISSLGKK